MSGEQGPRAAGKGMRAIAIRAARPTARPIDLFGGAEAEAMSGEQGPRAAGKGMRAIATH